jgi:hypothetical protein
MENFSQLDQRWAGKKIGMTNLLIKDYGCTVSCLADAVNDFGGFLTPYGVAKALDFTSEGKILWNSISKIGMKFIWRGPVYDSSKVNAALNNPNKNQRILLELSIPGSELRHWVLANKLINIGKYQVRDPLGGSIAEYPSSLHPMITGYAIVEQLPPPPPAISEWAKDGYEFCKAELGMTSGPQEPVTAEILATILFRYHQKFYGKEISD